MRSSFSSYPSLPPAARTALPAVCSLVPFLPPSSSIPTLCILYIQPSSSIPTLHCCRLCYIPSFAIRIAQVVVSDATACRAHRRGVRSAHMRCGPQHHAPAAVSCWDISHAMRRPLVHCRTSWFCTASSSITYFSSLHFVYNASCLASGSPPTTGSCFATANRDFRFAVCGVESIKMKWRESCRLSTPPLPSERCRMYARLILSHAACFAHVTVQIIVASPSSKPTEIGGSEAVGQVMCAFACMFAQQFNSTSVVSLHPNSSNCNCTTASSLLLSPPPPQPRMPEISNSQILRSIDERRWQADMSLPGQAVLT